MGDQWSLEVKKRHFRYHANNNNNKVKKERRKDMLDSCDRGQIFYRVKWDSITHKAYPRYMGLGFDDDGDNA